MSQLDRLTGLKRLRVRGLARVSFAAHLKAAGINIMRAAAFRKREIEKEQTPSPSISTLVCAVKDRLQLVSTALWQRTRLRWMNMYYAALNAA